MMIITVASFKGGVGNTTSAIHLAAYFQEKAPTLLIDGDQNRSATTWAEGGNLAFKVVSETQAPKYIRNFEHLVIDTQARPEQKDLEALADGCDLLILSTTPKALGLDALLRTVDVLDKLGANFKVLLTIASPAHLVVVTPAAICRSMAITNFSLSLTGRGTRVAIAPRIFSVSPACHCRSKTLASTLRQNCCYSKGVIHLPNAA